MTTTALESVSIPKRVTNYIMIGALASLLKLTGRHITELTEAVGQPATRLEVFILSYLRNLIPLSMNPLMGVGFADNREYIFQQLVKNFAITELPRICLTDTAASLEIDIQSEMNRPHAEFNLLDLLYLEQAILCLAQPETSSWMQASPSGNGNIPNYEIKNHAVRQLFLTSAKHLNDRFPYCEWFTIIVLSLDLFQGEDSDLLITPEELKIIEGPKKAIRELLAAAYGEALAFRTPD